MNPSVLPIFTPDMLYITQRFTIRKGDQFYGSINCQFPVDENGDPAMDRTPIFEGEVVITLPTPQGPVPAPVTFAIDTVSLPLACQMFFTEAERKVKELESRLVRQQILRPSK